MSGKILPLARLSRIVADLRREGKRVVFTNGCFDLMHPGHTRYLRKAKAHGDVLVVAVNSDRSVRELKGEGRPITGEAERAEILAALSSVDYVTIFDDPTPLTVIKQLRPDILVKGSGWKPDEIVGREEVEAAGGRVVSMEAEAAFSTTALIQSALAAPGRN